MFSSDVGSMPHRISVDALWRGARRSTSMLPLLGLADDAYDNFKNEILTIFADKVKAGVDIPNYPQLRDMNEMFFELISGYEKHEDSYIAHDKIKPIGKPVIPETEIIKQESSIIREIANVDKIRVKVCVTGPYTLASFFKHKSPGLFEDLGHCIAVILRESFYRNKTSEICHVSIDEPVLGFLNDPLLDYGAEGREALLGAWEEIAYAGASRGLDVSMHLHNTSEGLFWDVEHLGLVGSHVDDPLYVQDSTRRMLVETDKFLWVPLCITQYDTLIENYYRSRGFQGNIPEKVGLVWTDIRRGNVDPYTYLEDQEVMRKRIVKVADFFGWERLAYGSPECGFKGFPEYDVALECLHRSSEVLSHI